MQVCEHRTRTFRDRYEDSFFRSDTFFLAECDVDEDVGILLEQVITWLIHKEKVKDKKEKALLTQADKESYCHDGESYEEFP